MKFEISPKSTETELNWQDAIIYCQFLDINGYGWRLPTLDELNDIYDLENDFEIEWYWSSTEYDNNTAWYHNFGIGYQSDYFNKNNSNNVRAIRDL